MNEQLNRLRAQIDFRPTRGHQDADLLFTVLMHYNRGGNTDMTATQLITTAFASYDASETVEITRLIDTRTRAKSFASAFGIRTKKDIKRAITDTPDEHISLLEPDKKFVCFDGNDPKALELWDTINSVRFRDRGILINMWLYQYFSRGLCDYYNRVCANRILSWLKDEYELMKDIDAEKINTVANCLWADSRDFGDEDLVVVEEDSEDISDEDRLRNIMGVKAGAKNGK